MVGYWNKPEQTATSLLDGGWYRSGDVGRLDEEGYLYLVDRAKDLIIVSGFNVYPAEVEGVLVDHPTVDRAVVVGEIDDDHGERVVAYVTPTDGALRAMSAH